MASLNIILTGLAECELELVALRDSLQSAWSNPREVTFDVCTTGELNFQVLETCDAILLDTHDLRGHESMRYVLSLLEQSGRPVVALAAQIDNPRDPFAFAGHMLIERTADASSLCSSLTALIHRQTEILRLRRELTISTKQHSGLRQQLSHIHEELQLAAMVQREYLPREMPTLCGVDAAVLWRPASYVSGDIYDVMKLDDDHLGVFVADAVGHGVPAALLTMIICKSLRTTQATDSGVRILQPSEVLRHLNEEMIHRRSRSTRFATAIYAVVNCRQRTMQIARAGHPAPLLFSQGQSQFLEPSGGLLGVFADEEYEQIELDLCVGDRLLIYSDGFEQAFPDLHDDSSGKPLPNRKYLDVFEELRAEDGASRLIDSLADRLDVHQGSLHPIDDLTMLCVHAGSLVQDKSAPDLTALQTRPSKDSPRNCARVDARLRV